jgi:hypothetical protein
MAENDEVKMRYPFHYRGNLFWLIFFLIIFFPVGIVLLLLNLTVVREDMCYGLKYNGSKFWLIFWTVLFFPIAIILGAINGFDVIGQPCD